MALAAFVGRGNATLLSFPRLLAFPSSSPSPFRISYPHHRTTFKYCICGIHKKAVELKTSSKEEDRILKSWKIKMLYDGECPLCMREVNMLKERNKLYGSIKFVDISSNEYSSEENQGLDYQTVMGRIHAILSDGTVVRDVEAFRRLYEEVGLGWVYAITKYEPIATIANAVYGVWAKFRLQITGRPSLEDILMERKKNMGEACNDNKSCRM
eukprot:TRINITY_DN4131_c1_g1_i1.p1 TRINITY_DN4131_c1_g1~~TRINITY_DN4131_c1_g1_i1.p1  ORF type:complete len:212 (-),score=37.13 TRINITY_DN4131_c1_g1_i1:226-861(-)